MYLLLAVWQEALPGWKKKPEKYHYSLFYLLWFDVMTLRLIKRKTTHGMTLDEWKRKSWKIWMKWENNIHSNLFLFRFLETRSSQCSFVWNARKLWTLSKTSMPRNEFHFYFLKYFLKSYSLCFLPRIVRLGVTYAWTFWAKCRYSPLFYIFFSSTSISD